MFEFGEVCTNHCVPSYCIGCPASFGFLSDTRLMIVNLSLVDAIVLINIGFANCAFVFDAAILI